MFTIYKKKHLGKLFYLLVVACTDKCLGYILHKHYEKVWSNIDMNYWDNAMGQSCSKNMMINIDIAIPRGKGLCAKLTLLTKWLQ